jgi:hypothetical protein
MQTPSRFGGKPANRISLAAAFLPEKNKRFSVSVTRFEQKIKTFTRLFAFRFNLLPENRLFLAVLLQQPSPKIKTRPFSFQKIQTF